MALSPPAIAEAACQTPVVGEFDAVVCGGGPAGVAAALAAARAGARTALIEAEGCLGGIWTSGLMPWVIDHRKKGGLTAEIVSALRRAEGRDADAASRSAFEVEAAKHALERLCLASGVRLRLHTRLCAVSLEGRRIRAAITESPSGREAWVARAFVDATGDGDLAARAGCGFDYGREGTDGEAQPASLSALLTGVDPAAVSDCLLGFSSSSRADTKAKLRQAMEAAGVSPSYGLPSLFHVRDDLFLLMANHQYGVRGFDADSLTAATLEARDEIRRLVAALRRSGGPWAGLLLVATGARLGIREGRRVHGLYRVSREDLERGARFEDAICRVTVGVDVHSTDPKAGKGMAPDRVRALPYDLPLRALVARDASNLLLAGRCVSGDFFAHASYRVTGNALAMGEAAGVAAALASAGATDAHSLDPRAVRARLLANGAFLQ
jgi:hypothetical protein